MTEEKLIRNCLRRLKAQEADVGVVRYLRSTSKERYWAQNLQKDTDRPMEQGKGG